MRVRIGVLGCGNVARAAHLRSLAGNSGAEVVAIADADAANLAAAQRLAPDAKRVANYADLLTEAGVDAVVIALPPAIHADAAIAALQSGKHVYVEKPLATTVADAARVISTWQGSRLTGMMGFNYRYNPIVRQARLRIAAGAIGQPIAVRTVFATPRRAMPSWKQNRDTGGGALLDLAVHHIDLVRFLLDADVASVSAQIHSTITDQDTAFLQLGLTNGVTAQSMCSLSAVDEDRIEVYGSKAKVTIDRYRSLRAEETPASAGGTLSGAVVRLLGEMGAAPYAFQKRRAPLHDPSFPAAMNAFVRAIQDHEAATPSLVDGLRALVVIEAAELSASAGRAILLDSAAVAPSI
jgi:myo-inositol 2-dehydrogenase/D-chiro-inositol 1-dehydrogenase